MFKYINSVLFVFTVLVNVSYSQNGKVLTLQECIDIALKDNSQFRTTQQQVNFAGANVTSAWSAWLPRIDLTLNSARNAIGETENFLSIQRTVIAEIETVGGDTLRLPFPAVDSETGRSVVDRVEVLSPARKYPGHSMTLRYNHTIFDFGRTISSIKQAKSSFNSAAENLTAARYAVHANVSQNYFELLKALRLEDEYREAVERSNGQLERTKSMYEIGSVARIDVYRQEEILGFDEINFITQRNVVQIAKANLNVEMGRDPETPITIAGTDQVSGKPEYSLQEAISIAEQNSPALRSFEYDMNAANHGRKSARSNFLPSLGVGITYSRDNQDFNRVYKNFSKNYFFQFGASFSWNVFNGFADKATLERETAIYNIAEENWLQERRNVYVRVKQQYLNLTAYNEIADINQRNLRAAEEGFRLAQERYRVGAGTQLEVTDAQVVLTRSRVTLVRVKYDAMIAKTQLEAAMGTIEEKQSN